MSELPGNPDNDRSSDAPDPDGPVAASLVCVGCFYDLRSQPKDGSCPECGRPISDTLNHPGGALVLADPKWLRQVWLGAAGMALCALLGAAATLLWAYAYFAALGVVFLIDLLQLVSLLLMTSYEPAARNAERREMPREATRWFGVLAIMTGVVQQLVLSLPSLYAMIPLVDGCQGFLSILTMVAFAFFVRSLLGRTTRNLAWPLALLPAILLAFSVVVGWIRTIDQPIAQTLYLVATLAWFFSTLCLYSYFAWRIRAIAQAAASIR